MVDIEVARAVRVRLGAAFGAESAAFVRVVVLQSTRLLWGRGASEAWLVSAQHL